jgi:hypothetical protein
MELMANDDDKGKKRMKKIEEGEEEEEEEEGKLKLNRKREQYKKKQKDEGSTSGTKLIDDNQDNHGIHEDNSEDSNDNGGVHETAVSYIVTDYTAVHSKSDSFDENASKNIRETRKQIEESSGTESDGNHDNGAVHAHTETESHTAGDGADFDGDGNEFEESNANFKQFGSGGSDSYDFQSADFYDKEFKSDDSEDNAIKETEEIGTKIGETSGNKSDDDKDKGGVHVDAELHTRAGVLNDDNTIKDTGEITVEEQKPSQVKKESGYIRKK